MVALGQARPTPRILLRRKIELVDPDAPGGRQPYHAAQDLPLAQATRLLEASRSRILDRARTEMESLLGELEASGAKAGACGVLTTGSGRVPKEVERILASHMLLHAAEGLLYREAVVEAAKTHRLKVTEIPEKEVVAEHARRVHLAAPAVEDVLAAFRKEVGPPFRQDERLASLAAWTLLG
jgi:hypothetical protein